MNGEWGWMGINWLQFLPIHGWMGMNKGWIILGRGYYSSFIRVLKDRFGILGFQGKKLGFWDFTKFEIGILEIWFEIGILDFITTSMVCNSFQYLDFGISPHLKLGFWDFTIFEIGTLGFRDPLFQDVDPFIHPHSSAWGWMGKNWPPFPIHLLYPVICHLDGWLAWVSSSDGLLYWDSGHIYM